MNIYKLYTITGTIDGQIEELYCSYDRSDCVYEKDCEKDTWKEQGYKKITIGSRIVEEQPSAEVYDSATTGELKPQLEKVMKQTTDKLEGDVDPSIHKIEKNDDGEILVHFSDEDMSLIIAGYIPCNTFDAMDKAIVKLGLSMVDSDGATLILELN